MLKIIVYGIVGPPSRYQDVLNTLRNPTLVPQAGLSVKEWPVVSGMSSNRFFKYDDGTNKTDKNHWTSKADNPGALHHGGIRSTLRTSRSSEPGHATVTSSGRSNHKKTLLEHILSARCSVKLPQLGPTRAGTLCEELVARFFSARSQKRGTNRWYDRKLVLYTIDSDTEEVRQA